MINKGVSTMVRFLSALVLVALVALPASAQTYLTSTTTSATVSSDATTVVVASASGIAAGGALYIDRELMTVRSVSGTTVTVVRGQSGTRQTSHGSSRTVVVIPAAAVPSVITTFDPGPGNASNIGLGTCTAASYQYLPLINVTNGNVWLCRGIQGSAGTAWYATNSAPVTYNSLLLNLS